MTPAVRTNIRRETVISVLMNAAIGAGFFVAVFGIARDVPVWGSMAYAFDFLPQGFIVGLMASLVPRLLMRKRIMQGTIAPLGVIVPSLAAILMRSIVLALLSMTFLAGGAIAILAASDIVTLPITLALPLKIAATAMIAAIVTPAAMRATAISA